jgi:hypothetical protein
MTIIHTTFIFQSKENLTLIFFVNLRDKVSPLDWTIYNNI